MMPQNNSREADTNNAHPAGPEIRSIVHQGLLIIILFFGVLGVWASFCEITGAIVAPGTIKIESERKTVQHLEGGIIDSILVREGQEVKKGQLLVLLESVQIEASESMLEKQLVALLAARVRFAAEKALQTELRWSDDLRRMADATGSVDVLENENLLFHARSEALRGQLSLLEAQLAQIDAQISGYQEQVNAEKTILRTLKEEIHAKRQLYQQRYLAKSDILELERAIADHQGNHGRMIQAIAEAKQKEAELRLRIADAKNRFIENAAAQLGRLDNEVTQVRERIRPLNDARKRLQVVAPVDGRIVDLKVHSKGGVVRSGEALMDIVPKDNPLIVETRTPVHRITEMFVGQEALVQLDAFDARVTPHIPAKVTYVSADRLEERTNAGAMPYYLCYAEIHPDDLAQADLYISPGMPVTVFITTRKRTVLYYIFESMLKNWELALRE